MPEFPSANVLDVSLNTASYESLGTYLAALGSTVTDGSGISAKGRWVPFNFNTPYYLKKLAFVTGSVSNTGLTFYWAIYNDRLERYWVSGSTAATSSTNAIQEVTVGITLPAGSYFIGFMFTSGTHYVNSFTPANLSYLYPHGLNSTVVSPPATTLTPTAFSSASAIPLIILNGQ